MDARRIGAQILTMEDLHRAAYGGDSVTCPRNYQGGAGQRAQPAMFIWHQSCEIVWRQIKSGLYIYLKEGS